MIRALAALALLLAASAPCHAWLSERQLKEAVLAPKPGATLPLGAEFVNSADGARVTLGGALGGRPAALLLVSYRCRFTCGTALALTAAGLSQTGLEAGRDFTLLVMGIDPKDGPADAEAMKAAHLAPYPALMASAKFLNGSAASITHVTEALGYKPVYDEERGEFAHPLGVVILTGDGRAAQVIAGLNFDPGALASAINDARQSRLSQLIQGIRLLCYGHGPAYGVYASTIQAVLMTGGLLTLLGIAGTVTLLARRKGAQS